MLLTSIAHLNIMHHFPSAMSTSQDYTIHNGLPMSIIGELLRKSPSLNLNHLPDVSNIKASSQPHLALMSLWSSPKQTGTTTTPHTSELDQLTSYHLSSLHCSSPHSIHPFLLSHSHGRGNSLHVAHPSHSMQPSSPCSIYSHNARLMQKHVFNPNTNSHCQCCRETSNASITCLL